MFNLDIRKANKDRRKCLAPVSAHRQVMSRVQLLWEMSKHYVVMKKGLVHVRRERRQKVYILTVPVTPTFTANVSLSYRSGWRDI